MKKHWSEIPSCHLCGRRFRNQAAEAWHRHNAAMVCKGYKQNEILSKSNASKLSRRLDSK